MELRKINPKQLFTIFVLGVLSPIIRMYAILLCDIGKQSAWVGAFVGFIPMLILIHVIKEYYKKNPNRRLEDIICDILGNILGKIVLSFIIIWMLLEVVMITRASGGRYVSSIYTLSTIDFFIGVFLGLVFIVARGKIQYFARLAEVLFIIQLLTLGIIILLTIPEIKFSNLYPVTTNDFGNIIKMQVPIMGITAYMFGIFFIGSNLSTSEEIKKYGIKGITIVTIIAGLSLVSVIGIFGAEIANNLSIPFLMAVKEINILGKIYGLESIFVSLWLIPDLVFVVCGIYVIKNLLSKVTSINVGKEYITPIVFIIFILSLYIVNNLYEYEYFMKNIMIVLNIVIGYILPVLILIIGKIRKKV